MFLALSVPRVLPVFALAVLAGSARAGTPTAEGGAAEHSNHFATGVFGSSYLVVDPDDHLHGHYGGGAFFEAHVIPHALAIEFGIQVLKAPEAVELPFDLLFKVPFHAAPWAEPFIGAGPSFVPAIHDGTTSWHFGAAIVAGAYWWVHPHVAILTGLNYNIIANGGAQHEIGLMVGPVYGF